MTAADEGISISRNGHSIEIVNAQNNLGITAEKCLVWDQQITLVCQHVR